MLDYREEEYWQDHVDKPWNHFKYLERDKYEVSWYPPRT